MKYLIGVDGGNTNIKAVLFNEKGEIIAEHSEPNKRLNPRGKGFEEFDVNEAWNAAKICLKSILEESKVDPEDIVSMGVTSFGNGAVFVDDEGEPVCPGISSQDSRAEHIIDMYKEKGSWEKINKLINCNLFPGEPGPLLKWYKDNHPDIYKRVGCILQLKDYFIYKLTGRLATDYNIFGIAGMIDSNKLEYTTELFDLYEIPELSNKVPYLADTLTEIIGTINKETSQSTGLSENTKVVAGFMDILAALVGSGATEDGVITSVAGTWCINASHSDYVIPEANANMPYINKGEFVHCSYSGAGSANYEWFNKTLAGNAKLEAAERGISFYEVLNEAISSVKPEEATVLYLPYVAQPNPSDVHREARGNIYNLNHHTSFEEVVYAVTEGIIFLHKKHIQFLIDKGEPVKKIRLCGGMAKSKQWVQNFATIVGLPIEVVDCDEVGALGMAITAGIGAGLYKDYDDAFEKTLNILPAVYPDLEKEDIYAERYSEWEELTDVMTPYWINKEKKQEMKQLVTTF